MRLIITFLMAWCLSWGAYAATAPDSKQITQELEQAKKDVERLSGEAIKILDEFEGEHTFLHDLFFYLINRDH